MSSEMDLQLWRAQLEVRLLSIIHGQPASPARRDALEEDLYQILTSSNHYACYQLLIRDPQFLQQIGARAQRIRYDAIVNFDEPEGREWLLHLSGGLTFLGNDQLHFLLLAPNVCRRLAQYFTAHAQEKWIEHLRPERHARRHRDNRASARV